MTANLAGLIVGGLLPALLYGICGIFAKISANMGMPVGWHLVYTGLAISAVGVVFQGVFPGVAPSLGAIASSSLQGLLWGSGTGLVVLGLINYHVPLAKLVPLYNMNTLITVGLALWIFAEWRQANPLQLLTGAMLIVLGGILVARA